MQIVEREIELEHHRAMLRGQQPPAVEELAAIRGELAELAAERQRLLSQVDQAEVAVRAQLNQQSVNREAITAKRGRRALPKVTKAERRTRAKQAMLASERAWLDGTVRRDREWARDEEAIWNTCHDPETFGSDDW
jgi:hypothetical protein